MRDTTEGMKHRGSQIYSAPFARTEGQACGTTDVRRQDTGGREVSGWNKLAVDTTR